MCRHLPATYGAYVDALASRLLQQRMRAEHKTAVLTFFGKTSDVRTQVTDAAVTWKFGTSWSLILNSPYHALR